ncbi:UDP-N-acetylmuramoyl-L-alanine--D-glutamate ligase [Alloacidobacterium dinghuense]|uniref:UDP-N-acetylmuramoylalanine--D-glutamate ligase n=1 Tax=Alloacidobacterium dinghuense TaxID=2763107 RepID=A0A7G8BJA9_9BACT|nr:UDP-N-acetylmuramoyl-L-alanine--D-glutamate ligase [Alloacidobacterium dinghuense]QNI32629.1 UDP-N-acetylmuramoyl-L-alanine--D-glutamate ligase [Alloacidobacterium dinghuense]
MEFKGKKVLVVGLGRSGLAAALFLRRRGAQVTVSDIRSAEQLGKEIPALLEEGISVEAGGHGLLTFRRQDLIVVSPGVPIDTPELVQVKAFGLPIIGELELATEYLKGKSLAITGSNGKTTTTSLCGEILEAGKLAVQVGGNIGVPVIALVDQSRDDGWSVLEVSSFQLETTSQFRPEIAVILNVTPDHLDRHGTFENYAAAKERIFANQTAEDALVLNADDDVTSRMAARAKSRIFWFSAKRVVRQGAFVHEGAVVFRPSEQAAPEFILKVENIPLKGHHNVENVLAAVCASRLAGVEADAIRKAVESFKAVEHRLEFVADINGVDYYNDSKATNVDAAAKAIAAFPGGIHLILGGKDKNSDYRQLRSLLEERVKAVYTIGAAAEKIETHIYGTVPVVSARTLDQAVAKAAEAAQPGEIVLLAPACSSFDQFENYEHRGQVFKELVHARQGVWQNA